MVLNYAEQESSPVRGFSSDSMCNYKLPLMLHRVLEDGRGHALRFSIAVNHDDSDCAHHHPGPLHLGGDSNKKKDDPLPRFYLAMCCQIDCFPLTFLGFYRAIE